MGLLVSFEGAEGSGKTTQIHLLQQTLFRLGYAVTTTREPGGTRIGEKIRDLLLAPVYQEMAPLTEAFLYAADRAQHLHQIVHPALHRKEVVLTDRFVDASLVYQGVAQGLGLDLVEKINHLILKGLRPHLTLLLDIDPLEGIQRLGSQGDRIEAFSLSFHQKVRETYLQMAQKEDRFIVLDASRTVEDLHQQIKMEILERLRKDGPHAFTGL